jgi:hypothetical protein
LYIQIIPFWSKLLLIEERKKMKKKLSSITIALLLVVMLVSTAFAAESREFQLKGSLDASETQQVIFPTANINLTGTGNATHLGLYTYNLQASLHLPTLISTVSATLVAADGSTLFLAGSGIGTPTNVPGVVSIVETFTITGGTGRFDGASGYVTVERLLNRATLTSTGSISGTIVLP